jgi:tetratricopeptide (TPR) repeat protein
MHSITVLVLLLLSIAAVYSQVVHHDYVSYDDAREIFENPQLGEPIDGKNLVRTFTDPFFYNWIPLTALSLHLDRQVYGSDPTGYLVTNVALHSLSAVMLFWVLCAMTGAILPSAFVAGVFALHPLHVESVAWISERKDVLSGFFWMLTLVAYSRYSDRPSLRRYLLVSLSLLLGLMAKPMVVTLPFVLLLLDYWPLGRLDLGQNRSRVDSVSVSRIVAEKIPLLALAAISSVLTFRIQRETGAMAQDGLPWSWRLQQALEGYGTYMVQAVWPSQLAVIYPLPVDRPEWLWAGISGGVILAATAVAFHVRRRRPYLAMGWLWFLGTLVPVIGLVRVGTHAHADRYMYLPLIGLAIAVAWCVWEERSRWAALERALPWLAAGVLISFGVTSHQQVGFWRDSQTLFERALDVTEDNYVAHDGLATVLAGKGLTADAERHYLTAARLHPRWSNPEQGLGLLYLDMGRHAAAVRHLDRAVALDPANPLLRANLGVTLMATGHPETAIPHLERALELERGYGRARMLALLAGAQDAVGRKEEAIQSYAAAVALQPSFAEAHANLGLLAFGSGRIETARHHLRQARSLGVESALVSSKYADLLAATGDPAAAVVEYRRALRIDGEFTPAANNLAWLLATAEDPAVRDPRAAIVIAERLVARQSRPEPTHLDTLAAAYAAAGRFADAERTAEDAALAAEVNGDFGEAAEIRLRLSQYREGRPFPGDEERGRSKGPSDSAAYTPRAPPAVPPPE